MTNLHTYPDQATTLQILGEWQAQHDRIADLMHGVSQVFGLLPEGPVSETVWGLWDQYTKTIGQLIGDHGDWLAWYYLENDMGDKGMQAGYDKNLRDIDTLANLQWLIDESKART